MGDKFLGIFDKRPLIYFHYVLLVGVLWLALEVVPSTFGYWSIWGWIFVWITVGDQLIHYVLGVD